MRDQLRRGSKIIVWSRHLPIIYRHSSDDSRGSTDLRRTRTRNAATSRILAGLHSIAEPERDRRSGRVLFTGGETIHAITSHAGPPAQSTSNASKLDPGTRRLFGQSSETQSRSPSARLRLGLSCWSSALHARQERGRAWRQLRRRRRPLHRVRGRRVRGFNLLQRRLARHHRAKGRFSTGRGHATVR